MNESRRNLILVRAGDRSLHPQWLAASRNWDLAVSYYGNHPERYRDQYDYLHCFVGSKWEGVTDFVARHLDLIEGYEYLWIPDDDLFTTAGNIDRFFDFSRLLDLSISQPALTPYSYRSWDITVQQPQLVARLTDFVEIMAPCFRVRTLSHFSAHFGENSSGFGYEWLWKAIAEREGILRFGVVDATPVYHTRAVGSAGHGGARQDPKAEMESLMTRYGIRAAQPRVLATVTLADEASR